MKNLTIVLFAVLFVSCGNKKAEIVEQIKVYKDSLNTIKRDELKISEDDNKKHREMFWSNGKVDLKKVNDPRNQKEYSNYQIDDEVKKWKLKFRKAKFDKLIDSLELELKKY
jgi:hypothetical protein